MKRQTLALAALLACMPTARAANPQLPAFPAPPKGEPVTETKFGITTTDPFRRLEDLKDPEVQAWMKAQAARTRAVLDSIPGRAGVLRDIERLAQATTSRVADAQVLRDGRLLVLRQEAGDDIARLLLLDNVDAPQGRVLVDPEDWRKRTGKPHAINYFTASPDGRHVLVGISESGTELANLHVLDLATGKPVETPISRIWYGSSVQWLPDSSGFVYSRLNALDGQPVSERELNSQAYLHRLGDSADQDPIVFGNRQPGSTDVPPPAIPLVRLSAGGDFMLGCPLTRDNRHQLYIAPAAQLGNARIEWKRLIERDDEVYDFAMDGNDLYLITSSRPGRAIERFRLPDGQREVIVEGDADTPIDALALREGALYYITRASSGVGSRLHRLPRGQTVSTEIHLQGLDDASWLLPAQEGVSGLIVIGTGWTRFPTAMRIDADGTVHPSRLQPPPGDIDTSQLVSTVVEVPSHDGTKVPLSIIHHTGIKRDGSNPTLLNGYGFAGISISPVLVAGWLAYYDRGIIRAFCHARGGGEKGEAWHKGGFQATKSNTWKDFNACAQYLIDNGYTSPYRLAALGSSGGGILVGNAMIERPDLYRVLFPTVGVLDSIGIALRSPHGPVLWPEMGDPNTKSGYRSLHAMSSYFKVEDGTPYPAVMLIHGVEDPRVPVWQSSKMAARLQQASSSGLPVLLRLDYQAGHGIGSTQGQINSERADLISFMLWQFGVPGFQPESAAAAVADSPVSVSDDAPGQGEVVEAVQQMFSALEADDPARFGELTTPDFYAFDMGKVMTADQLIEVVANVRNAGLAFDWQVTEPRVHIDGQTAWITYVNRGSIRQGADTKQTTWLESAVLRKAGDAWRIRFLHSTVASDK